jgi:hypothetical protein
MGGSTLSVGIATPECFSMSLHDHSAPHQLYEATTQLSDLHDATQRTPITMRVKVGNYLADKISGKKGS